MESSEEEREDDEEGGASGGEAALEHPSYAVLEEKLTLAEQQAHENWEKAVRAMAELENVRRRAERDVANAHRYGLEKLIHGFLPVIDSLEQALQLAEKHADESMREGLSLTIKLFMDALKSSRLNKLIRLVLSLIPKSMKRCQCKKRKTLNPIRCWQCFKKDTN